VTAARLATYEQRLRCGRVVASEERPGAWEAIVQAWIDGLTARAQADGLIVTSWAGWDNMRMEWWGGGVAINWPDGRPYSYTPEEHGRFPAVLELAWGDRLIRARQRCAETS